MGSGTRDSFPKPLPLFLKTFLPHARNPVKIIYLLKDLLDSSGKSVVNIYVHNKVHMCAKHSQITSYILKDILGYPGLFFYAVILSFSNYFALLLVLMIPR